MILPVITINNIEAEWRICASVNYVIIGSVNGLSLVRRQDIIWINAGLWSIWALGTYFSEMRIERKRFSCQVNAIGNVCKMAAILSRVSVYKHVEARTKWLTCCCWYFHIRDHSGYGLSQWEVTWHFNIGLSPYPEWSLHIYFLALKFHWNIFPWIKLTS